MFTGIIEQTGTLVSLTDRGGVRRITVEAPRHCVAAARRRLARRLRRLPHRARSRPHLLPRRPRPGNPRSHLARLARARRSRQSGTAHRRRQPARRPHCAGPRRRHRRDDRARPRDSRIQSQLRPPDHRLDPQSPRPRKRSPVDGAQRLGRRGGHQPDDRRISTAKRSASPFCRSPTGAPICTRSPWARP